MRRVLSNLAASIVFSPFDCILNSSFFFSLVCYFIIAHLLWFVKPIFIIFIFIFALTIHCVCGIIYVLRGGDYFAR
nr:MAG TPA: hypothetical protein [Caudoviricetes sp.]